MPRFGLMKGLVRTDQGGELARCHAFKTLMLQFG
jgi:hypothetical protein